MTARTGKEIGAWSVIFGLIGILVATVAMAGGMDQVQKMGEIKGGSESLWEFARRAPAAFEAQIFYAVLIFGGLGMLANYAVKWMRREIEGSLIIYLFRNFRSTALAFSTTMGVGIAAITSGVFETSDGMFVGWFNVMWTSLMNGFMWDAALNRSGAQTADTKDAQGDAGGGRP